jgi:hypothetical protein
MEKKNRFVSILMVVMAVVLTTSLLGCSSSSDDDSVTENKYLPNKFSVTIPKSLQKSDASSNIKGSERSLSGRNLQSGYASLTNDIETLMSVNGTAALFFVLADEVINQNKLQPVATSHGTVQMTVTQDLIDRVLAISGDPGMEEESKAYLGKQIPMDNFVYASTTVSPYNFTVSFSCAAMGNSDTITIYWSSDLKKVKYSSVSPNGFPDDGISYLDNEFSYDDDLKATSFVIYQKGLGSDPNDIVDSLLKLRMDGDNAAYVSDFLRDPPASMTKQTLVAYGDASGGMVKDTDGTFTFDVKGDASTSTAYATKFAAAETKLAEVPDLAAVTQ